MQDLTTATRRFAATVGADLVGFTGPSVSATWGARHSRWLERGFHGDMAYLARNPAARYDARSLLPECRSVIVIGVNYWQPHPLEQAAALRISRYAWGSDYHLAVADKLRAIGEWLSGKVQDHRWKACVDHSPLGEKAFAIAAGLGWEGRNSLLLNPQSGSYVFLGLLLTTAELAPDQPLEAGCGVCSLCLKACPVGALLGPGILDARRCISYLTTEGKAAVLPDEALHGWVYGCDACQDVCPYNAGLHPARDAAFAPRGWSRGLVRDSEMGLDDAGFEAKYTGTVIKRRKLQRWQAQVAVAADGSGGSASPGAEVEGADSVKDEQGNQRHQEEGRAALPRL